MEPRALPNNKRWLFPGFGSVIVGGKVEPVLTAIDRPSYDREKYFIGIAVESGGLPFSGTFVCTTEECAARLYDNLGSLRARHWEEVRSLLESPSEA